MEVSLFYYMFPSTLRNEGVAECNLALHEFSYIAQWIEHPPGVWEVMGWNAVGASDFSFVPHLCHADQFTFHIALQGLTFTIFINL